MPTVSNSHRWGAVALTASLMVSAISLGAQAEETSIQESLVPPMTAEESDEYDRILSAAALGIRLDEIVEGDEYATGFRALVDNLRDEHNFAGAYFGHLPTDSGVVVFVGPPSSAAVAEMSSSGTDVDVRTDARYTLSDLRALQEAIADSLVSNFPDDEFGIAIDEEANGLVIASQSANDDVVRAVQDLGIDFAPLVSELTSLQDDDTRLYHGEGGARIFSTRASCTTGFTVKRRSDGERGVTTAAHCESMTRMTDRTNGQTFNTPIRAEHLGKYGEVEWHATSGHDDYPYYWGDVQARRWTVNGVMSRSRIAKNDKVCSFSMNRPTNRTCVRVYSNDYTHYFRDHPACHCNRRAHNLVLMQKDLHTYGDSGGPWSYGSTAYGTVVGAIRSGGVWRGYFSAASAFPNALGVDVLK